MIAESEVPNGWELKSVEEVCKVILGNSPPGDSYNESGDGIPFIQGASGLGEKSPDTDRYTTEPSRVCEAGDTIICVRATLGDLVKADQEYCLGRGVAGIRAEDELLQQYVHHYLEFINKSGYWEELANGATFKSITKTDIVELPIPVPSLEEQERIVDVLDRAFDALDRVEELNDRVGERADEFIETVLHRAFNPEPENENGIPEHWNMTPLKKLGSFRNGKYLAKKNMTGSEYPVYGANGVIGHHSDYWIEDKCVIIGRVGSCGSVHRVTERAWISDNAIVFWPEAVVPEYVEYFLSNYDFEPLISQAAQPLIRQGDLKEVEIPVPPEEEQKEIVENIKQTIQISESVESHTVEVSNQMQSIKEGMLHQAFRGELPTNPKGEEQAPILPTD